MLKTFNLIFWFVGIRLECKTNIVITSAIPHEVSMMENGAFSLRISISNCQYESRWILHVLKWDINITKPKISSWGCDQFTKSSIDFSMTKKQEGKFKITDHEIKDIIDTFKDL